MRRRRCQGPRCRPPGTPNGSPLSLSAIVKDGETPTRPTELVGDANPVNALRTAPAARDRLVGNRVVARDAGVDGTPQWSLLSATRRMSVCCRQHTIVETSLSGSGEGLGRVIVRGYSTAFAQPPTRADPIGAGDTVDIEITGIGTLSNPVVAGAGGR
jgi:hypothetical protein